MRETGIVNREICDVLSTLGHTDELIVCDAGFAIPLGVRTVDISLAENKPTVPEVLAELRKHLSVEKLVLSEDTRRVVPTRFKELAGAFGPGMPVDVIPQNDLRARARQPDFLFLCCKSLRRKASKSQSLQSRCVFDRDSGAG